MSIIKFQTGTSSDFAALENKDQDTLYFISDKKRIYKGDVLYANGSEGEDPGDLPFADMLGSTLIKADEFGEIATVTADNAESSKIIRFDSSTTSADRTAEILLKQIPLGSYSILARMRIGGASVSDTIASIKVEAVAPDNTITALANIPIQSGYFSKLNNWESISFGVDFNGKKNSTMKITYVPTGSILSTALTVDLDYIAVVPAGTALGSIG